MREPEGTAAGGDQTQRFKRDRAASDETSVSDNQCSGENNGRAKMTDDTVNTARELRASGMSYRRIAAQLGHPLSTVFHAVTGRTWQHLDGIQPKYGRASEADRGDQ